jgi:hypothetical protein
VRDVIARPRPVQSPIPIWIGGNSKLSRRRAATKAQGWMPMMGGPQLVKTARTAAPGFSGIIAFMNLQDATLVFLIESQQWPSVATIAQSVYDRQLDGEVVDYRLLDDLIGEASGKGALRAIRQKYGPIAFEAILSPIMDELARAKPIRSTMPEWHPTPGEDPLTVGH